MMRPDQIGELEVMLDDHGLEHLLDQVAACLARRARWKESEALYASSEAIAKGRAPTWLTYQK
jgi:hypothetical protein